MTPTDTTYTVKSYYYHEDWKKTVSAHTYESVESFSQAMEYAEHHQAKGFDVKVFQETLVQIEALEGAVKEEEEIDEEIEWEDIHVDDLNWNDDEYDIRNEWGEFDEN